MHRYTSPFTWRTNPYAPFSFFAEDVVETVGPRMHTNLPVVWKPCGLAVHSVAKRNSCAAVATNLALPIAWRYPMMSAIAMLRQLGTQRSGLIHLQPSHDMTMRK